MGETRRAGVLLVIVQERIRLHHIAAAMLASLGAYLHSDGLGALLPDRIAGHLLGSARLVGLGLAL